MAIDMAQFHQVFFEESFEGLDVMEAGLLNLDLGAVDEEEINSIFRAAHSIKGGSGTFGFSAIADFTHIMETLLDEMRDGRRAVTVDAVDVLLRSVDCLREMLTATSDDSKLDLEQVAAQKSELETILTADGGASNDSSLANADTESEGPDQNAGNIIGWHIVFRPHPQMMRTGNDPLRIIQELSRLGDLAIDSDITLLPRLSEMEPEESYLCWDLHLSADIDREQVYEVFDWVEDDCDLVLEAIYGNGQSSEPEEKIELVPPQPERRSADRRQSNDRRMGDRRSKAAVAGGGSSIRVDTEKIDGLINRVGELVITQSMLSLLGEEFTMDRVERLQDGLAQLERHTRELQESVMQIRMLPISFTFSRFPRLVHDLSAKMGKKIELVMEGENTEVDKTVIEKIGDPLVHLVRNSLDHGIEMPEDRIAAGKPEVGTVHLSASHRGGNIVIEIRDDGKGLDKARIFDKAVEKGLVQEDQHLSDKQIYEFIFHAGFSTADKVSDVSGRGVGMDVVRRNINELGGNIEIQSEMGVGSTIVIRLPLTMAILDGQNITVGDETYIVPLVSIIESIQVQPEMINLMAGRGETFTLRDEYLPIVRIQEVLGVKNATATELTDGLLVVVEGDGRRCGLFVDDLVGQQQVVIKSLETNYQKVDGISGATILGDGSVALILDIPGIFRLASQANDLRMSA